MADQYHFRAGAKIISAMCMGALAGIGGCSSSIADADSSAVDASGSTHDSGGSTADSGGSTADSGGSTANPDGSTSQTDGPTTDTGGCAAGAGGSIARELGLTQYSGQITPNVLATDGDITTYQFDPAQGPVCMRGDEFRTFVRDVGSKDVAIFQQDGGLCWSGFCFATNKAATEMPRIDILDPALAENPVAKWNHVFVPYCDGSLFAGDVEYADNVNNRGPRYQRGLANITAALETVKMRFPNPDRVLLAGSSGGGYGLLLSGFLARHYFPDTELIVMADSGIGLAKDDDPEYIRGVLDELNLSRFIPPDCEHCLDHGHLTGLLGYLLDRDPQVRVGMYSSWYDTILTSLYLQVPAEQFATGLQQQTDRIHAAHPTRFRRFITDGIQHTAIVGKSSAIFGTDWGALEVPQQLWPTFLRTRVNVGKLKDTRIGGLTMAAWLAALVNNDPQVWVDIQQERGPAPI